MKTEFTDKGWREITIKNIIVESFGEKPYMPISQWLYYNKRYGQIAAKRKLCPCCRKKWEEMTGSVNIVFTNKGSKPVCDDCLKGLREIFDTNE